MSIRFNSVDGETHKWGPVMIAGDPFQVAPMEESDAIEWDSYVSGHPSSSIYHLNAWRRVITEVFRHESRYLIARHRDQIVGVLPMIRLKSALFGDYLVSLPYFNCGGVLADSARVSELLMAAATRGAVNWGCSHIEFRDRRQLPEWTVRTDKVGMELNLPETVGELSKQFGSKLRAQINKAAKTGACVQYGGEELVGDFYRVFSRNMRDLGTPVYPVRFFREIMRSFPNDTRIVLIRFEQQPVAAGFLIQFRDRVEIPWASSLRESNSLGANMLMYAKALEYAVEGSFKVFDFGRSSVGSGTHRFKKQWGAVERQLYWHYWLRDGSSLPQLNPQNPKYMVAISLWKRLPVWVANLLGPSIVKNLP